MADKDSIVRGIDYKSTFPFTHLFRSFRLAIDPSKLVLAMAALLLLYVGGRCLDGIWPEKYRAIPSRDTSQADLRATLTGARAVRTSGGEIALYENNTGDFAKVRKDAHEERQREIDRAVNSMRGTTDGKDFDVDSLRTEINKKRDDEIKRINEAFDKRSDEDKKKKENIEARDRDIQQVWIASAAAHQRADELEGEGLFIHFIEYEVDQVDALADAAVALDYRAATNALWRFFITAPSWAITQHPVFFSIFFLLYVLLMAICGGAITRIAAVQVARDEKISVRQALRFSTGKVLSFVFAPLIPIIIIVVIMLLLGAVSLFMSIPWFGGFWAVVVGALFFLALLAGLVMALTSLGLIGGGHLMYPTIAVEGSDSFDAVSRSFSYLYARPWQLIFYSLVALVYGAITYLFVRFFLYLLLSLTHMGMGLFMWGKTPDGAALENRLWEPPMSMRDLSPEPWFAVLGPGQTAGSWLMLMWVYLTLALLGAFAISLYFSSSTIIYYLMRREVDATAMDEVYLEPSDDEFAEPVTEATVTTTTVTTTTEPAAPATDPTPPADQPPQA